MTVGLDAQISPRFARWLAETFSVTAQPLRDLGLRDAQAEPIFLAAMKSAEMTFTQDSDFVELLERHGSPPKILWLTCGNSSDAAWRQIFVTHFPEALRFFQAGDELVEIDLRYRVVNIIGIRKGRVGSSYGACSTKTVFVPPSGTGATRGVSTT